MLIEQRGLDRKRAPPTILNVWRFGKPLEYSGLLAASEVPRSASHNQWHSYLQMRGGSFCKKGDFFPPSFGGRYASLTFIKLGQG